ncbi:MAG: HAD family hydrolase [Magnetococcales bacterium]|nr:HAD family hydrolase [Magnetococcales bacterium]
MSLKEINSHPFAQPPRAVIFDTDNTLYAYRPAHEKGMAVVRDKACRMFGLTPDSFDAHFARARQEVKERLGEVASSHSRLLYFQRFIELVGFRTQIIASLDLAQTYWSTFLMTSRLFPDVEEFLLDLTRAGILRAVVTDLNTEIQFRKLVYFGLDNRFDFIITSEEAGRDKPDPLPFQLALAKLDLRPEETWMIGDHLQKDIQGARSLGMVTLQKRHAGVEVGQGSAQADVIFDHFGELREFFGLLQQKRWAKTG